MLFFAAAGPHVALAYAHSLPMLERVAVALALPVATVGLAFLGRYVPFWLIGITTAWFAGAAVSNAVVGHPAPGALVIGILGSVFTIGLSKPDDIELDPSNKSVLALLGDLAGKGAAGALGVDSETGAGLLKSLGGEVADEAHSASNRFTDYLVLFVDTSFPSVSAPDSRARSS